MTTLILAVAGRAGDRLALESYDAGHDVQTRVDSEAGLIEALQNGSGATVALVAADPLVLTSAVVRAADAGGVRIVAAHRDVREKASAASLGVADALELDSPWSGFEEMIVSPLRMRTKHRKAEGRTIVVWGPTGAPGRTTIASAIAAELASVGRSVVLADADTYGGAVAPSLGLLDEAPGFAAACRLAGSGMLTTAELDRVAQHHGPAGGEYRVLTGISRANRWPEITADRVEAALGICRTWADDTVVDVGFNLETDEEIMTDMFAPRRNAATLTALAQADVVVAVGSADPVGFSRFLRAHAALLEVVPTAKVLVVLNRVRSSAVGVAPHQQAVSALRRFGGISEVVLVPDDRVAVDGAVLSARTVRESAPRSGFAKAMAKFVASEFLPAGVRRPRERSRERERERGRSRGRRSARSAAPAVADPYAGAEARA